MQWRIECKHSGVGYDFTGTLDEAIREAHQQCQMDNSRWIVWLSPANLRMAEVSRRGCVWIRGELSGEELTRLMRRHHKTIAGLAFRMGITQKRIRQVRDKGLADANVVRDWMEAIIGEDPGPLPERFRIRHRAGESSCAYCGCRLGYGDFGFAYMGEAFCSVNCCRQSRGFGKEAA